MRGKISEVDAYNVEDASNVEIEVKGRDFTAVVFILDS